MSKHENSKDALEFIHTLDSIAIKKQKEEIERLKVEVELLRKDRDLLFDSHKTALEHIQRLHWELRVAKEGKQS